LAYCKQLLGRLSCPCIQVGEAISREKMMASFSGSLSL